VNIAVLLAAYSAATVAVAPQFLARARWPYRAPRLGILAWFTLGGTALLAALLGCATLVVPAVGDVLAAMLHTSLVRLRHDYDVARGPAGVVLGGAVGVALLARLGYCAARHILATRRTRRRHLDSLGLLGSERSDSRVGVMVLPHPTPAAYCVPGRRPQVVITSATRDLLDVEQLRGVLAHERAHLRGRHALLLGCSAVWRRAFGPLPVFERGRQEVNRLLEMVADDAATAVCDRVRLAEALVLLAEAGARPAGAPGAVLAAGGPDALARVRRLAAPYRPLGTAYQALTLLALAVFALLPVAVSVAPALVATATL
jgi:hypothetical protein